MILGFAHITRNVAYERGLNAVANPPAKWPLMARRATMHWLALRPERGLMEEVVEYDTGVVDQRGRIEFDEAGCVWLPARDGEIERMFLCRGLGFQQSDESIEIVRLVSSVPKWGVTLNVCEDTSATIDPHLDIAGYAALAFYSSDVEADRDRAVTAGGRMATEPFTVTIGDKAMRIIMLRSPEGTIIELIQVKP